jgi:predicted phosphodiesterase
MKVAVLSDIHGNSYALEKVLETAKEADVERLLVLGDIVGYYYYPDRVLKLLENFKYDLIKGNHEVILQDLEESKLDTVKLQKKYGRGHLIALEKLDKQTRDWLYDLPFQKSVEIDKINLQMNHGSPWNYDDYLYPDTDIQILEKCDSKFHDFVLIGHSHYSFVYYCANSILINSGSVGQSRKKGGVAEWTLIDSLTGEFEIMETPYDTSALKKDAETIDYDVKYNLEILNR